MVIKTYLSNQFGITASLKQFKSIPLGLSYCNKGFNLTLIQTTYNYCTQQLIGRLELTLKVINQTQGAGYVCCRIKSKQKQNSNIFETTDI